MHDILSESDKILIEEIRLRYAYKGDLFHYLITLPSWVNAYTDIKRQRGRPKTYKTLFMETMKIAKKLQEHIEHFSGYMREQMHDEQKKEKPFSTFFAIENSLPFFINKCHINALRIPKDKGGQQGGSLPKDLTWLLMQQYEFNTGQEATCGWVELNDRHTGEFYQFIIELKPIIKKMGITLGEDRSIGQYTRELLTFRSQTRKKFFALIIIVLTNPEFFVCNCPNIASFFLFIAIDKLHLFRSPHFNFTQE
jgi:hypothetical protein